MAAQRSFAIVTGASTGIGFELARQCLDNGFNVLIAADEPEIEQAAARLRQGKGKSKRCRPTYPSPRTSTDFMPRRTGT